MLEIESLFYKYKCLPKQKIIYSGVDHIISFKNWTLFADIMQIKYRDDYYDYIYNRLSGVPMSVAPTLQSIYDLHRKTWERRWYLVHLLNTIRVMQNRIHAHPKSDNQFKITRKEEIIPNARHIIEENSHFELDDNHMKLLQVSLANYFLRQIDYPSIIGEKIVRYGMTEDALEQDLLEVFKIWLR